MLPYLVKYQLHQIAGIITSGSLSVITVKTFWLQKAVFLSTITTLSRFIKRSANQRYAIKRLDAGLTEQQKQRIVEQVPSRLRKLYHTGFKYESSRQFCSKFVFDTYKEALCIPVGEIETFGELLNSNPNAKLTFWKFWFLGSIPWERKTVTPASLWHHPGLVLIHAVGVETPQPELTEAV